VEPASIYFVLGIPLAGAALLALIGERRWAAEANATLSSGTFVASLFLAARVVADGPFTAPILPTAATQIFGLPDEALKEQQQGRSVPFATVVVFHENDALVAVVVVEKT